MLKKIIIASHPKILCEGKKIWLNKFWFNIEMGALIKLKRLQFILRLRYTFLAPGFFYPFGGFEKWFAKDFNSFILIENGGFEPSSKRHATSVAALFVLLGVLRFSN